MLNLIRMYMYRIVRMKSFYVILIILALMNITMPIINKKSEDIDRREEMSSGYDSEGNIGMSIIVEREDNGDYSFRSILEAPLRGRLYAIFIGIFAVLFASGDFTTGDIKNFGGAVRKRRNIVIAKALTITVYTLMFLGAAILTSVLGIYISGAKVLWQNMGRVMGYIGVQTLIHAAFAIVITALCQVIRSNLLNIIFVCLLTMNVMTGLYGLLEKFFKIIGIKNVKIAHNTISGRMTEYGFESTKMLGSTVVVCIAFVIVSMMVSSWWVTKKDLV